MTAAHALVSRAGGRVPPALAGVALTLLVVATAFWVSVVPGVGARLEYQRDSAGVELVLRALSGHLVHVGWSHLGWNLLGFLVLGVLCERGGRRGFACAVALSACAIPLALYLVEPGIGRYCGLSGLVSALFGILATRAIASHARSGRRVLALATAAIAVGFVWRLGWIWIRGDLWLLESSGFQLTPVPLSHAIGLLIGVLVESTESLRGPRAPAHPCAPARAKFARGAQRIAREESTTMRSSRSLRVTGAAVLAALALGAVPGPARADHARAAPSRGCADTASFWRETADACAECAARLRHAEAADLYRPAPRPREQRSARPAYPYRAYPAPPHAPPAHAYVPAAHRYPPRTGARAPGLLPVTAASAERSHDAVARALDPVVDPVLREATEAVGVAAGTAIGVALYPPLKVLEHVLGASD